MKIIYNPKDGAPITQWVFKGERKDPHYPDGFELQDKKIANGLMQYTDEEAFEILETYQFLQEISAVEAKKIVERPSPAEFKCDFPNCDFSSTAKIGLEGHKRKHIAENLIDNKAEFDPTLIPVSGGKRVLTPQDVAKAQDPLRRDIPNGIDRDGVDWYGDGVTVENPNDFGGQRQPGRGHFVG